MWGDIGRARLLERGGERRDGVVVRAALVAREDGLLDGVRVRVRAGVRVGVGVGVGVRVRVRVGVRVSVWVRVRVWVRVGQGQRPG